MKRERVDHVRRRRLKDQDHRQADAEEADVGHDPMQALLGTPAVQEQPDREDETRREHCAQDAKGSVILRVLVREILSTRAYPAVIGTRVCPARPVSL